MKISAIDRLKMLLEVEEIDDKTGYYIKIMAEAIIEVATAVDVDRMLKVVDRAHMGDL